MLHFYPEKHGGDYSMSHGGWFAYMRGASSESAKPRVTRRLLMRVLAYARPYRNRIIALLGTILLTTGLGLMPQSKMSKASRR